MKVVLPWPPSELSGHNNGSWHNKSKVIATHRALAFHMIREVRQPLPDEGDILVRVRFVPPDHRSDRVNYANRMKPYYDGIAEGLGINDRRFLPEYHYCEPQNPGRVEVEIIPKNMPCDDSCPPDGALKESGPTDAINIEPGLTATPNTKVPV